MPNLGERFGTEEEMDLFYWFMEVTVIQTKGP